MEIITIQGLNYQYGTEPILTDVNFSVNRGEFVCVTGVNGSGKSTLLKIIMKILKPSAGHVEVNTSDIAYLAQRAISFNPEFPVNVMEVVGLGLKRADRNRRHRINDALNKVKMVEYRNKHMGSLSGGQQQRVLLAKALVQRPELILLDEPTVGIDNNATNHICCALGELNKKEDVTVILVTHDIHPILQHANRVLQL